MFERYTEKARRTIFWARNEASKVGSPCIESEHLLLGLLQENKTFVESIDATKFWEDIRLAMARENPLREPTSTSVDLPLSHESKRVLAYGAEESERLGHKYIGVGHLLLGLLREQGSLPARLLREHGIEIGPVREQVSKHAFDETPADRNALHSLINALPDSMLASARNMLTRIQTSHSELQGVLSTISSELREKPRHGSRSTTRMEDGAQIRETQVIFHGHEITMRERWQMSDDSKQLKYSQHLRGPKREHQIEIDFDLT